MVSIAVGGGIVAEVASKKDVDDSADALFSRLTTRPRPTQRPISGTWTLPAGSYGAGGAAGAVDFGNPPPERAWIVRSVTVFGLSDVTTPNTIVGLTSGTLAHFGKGRAPANTGSGLSTTVDMQPTWTDIVCPFVSGVWTPQGDIIIQPHEHAYVYFLAPGTSTPANSIVYVATMIFDDVPNVELDSRPL